VGALEIFWWIKSGEKSLSTTIQSNASSGHDEIALHHERRPNFRTSSSWLTESKETLTVDRAEVRVCGKKTEKVLKIHEGRHDAVQLVCNPEVGKVDIAEWRANNASENFDRPKACLMPKCFRRIQEESCHEDVEQQGIEKGRNAQSAAKDEAVGGLKTFSCPTNHIDIKSLTTAPRYTIKHQIWLPAR
jgi:hypothetical protein